MDMFDVYMCKYEIGTIIQDRMVNSPLQIVPPLHKALLDDIQWAQKNEVYLFFSYLFIYIICCVT